MIAMVGMPGSLTTAVLALLGGHPELWPLPEVHVFSAQNLGELARADAAASARLGTEGVFTAGLAAALHGFGLLGDGPLEMTAFDRWLAARRSWSPSRTLALLEAAAAPRRLILKSGLLALDGPALERLRDSRSNATMIAVARHPVDTVTSLLRRERQPPPPGLAAYLLSLWLAALEPLQARRYASMHFLKAEDVLMYPRATLAPLFHALGLPFNETTLQAMMRTEEAPFLTAARRLPKLLAAESFVADPRLRPQTPSPCLTLPASWQIPTELAERVRRTAAAAGYR